jgi:hypothetical protein
METVTLTPLSTPCAVPADANETHTLQPLGGQPRQQPHQPEAAAPAPKPLDLGHLSRLQALRVLELSPDDYLLG